MTEEEARVWLDRRNVPRETLARLSAFGDALRDENQRQNLVAASTLDNFWGRHIVDSAQLLDHTEPGGTWIDLGSGAGFPGLVVAALSDRPVTLVESRSKRVNFLNFAIDLLALRDRVEVFGGRAEMLPQRQFATISARAFAPLGRLLTIAHRFAAPNTRWLLPKGRSAAAELEEVAGSWQGEFRIEQSVTDSDAAIIVARHVRPRRLP